MKCKYHKNTTEEIKIVSDGILITKHLNETLLTNNCGQPNEIKIKRNNVIKFKDCKVSIGRLQFENSIQTYHDKVLPNVEKNISITTIVKGFHLEDLHLQNVNNTRYIKEVKHESQWKWYTNITTDLIIIGILLVLCSYLYLQRRSGISKVKVHFTGNRPESIRKEGGVTSQETPTPFS